MNLIRRIGVWFRGWLPLRRAVYRQSRVVASLDGRIAAVIDEGRKRDARLERELERLERQFSSSKRQIELARSEIEQNESTLTAVREELRIADEVTIPSLVSAHRMLLERWDAETAILVRQRIASAPDHAAER